MREVTERLFISVSFKIKEEGKQCIVFSARKQRRTRGAR